MCGGDTQFLSPEMAWWECYLAWLRAPVRLRSLVPGEAFSDSLSVEYILHSPSWYSL